MAKKIKLSRKQIKQPDEFLSWSEQAWDWAAQNAYYLLGAVALILLGFIVIQGSIYILKTRSDKPETMLGEAMDIMRAPIIPANQAPPFGLPHYYGSEAERLQASIKALTEIVDQYGSSADGQMALLYLGQSWEQMRDYAKAGEYYQKFLGTKMAGKKPYLKTGATLSLGRALFEQKKLDEALARFDEVIKDGGAFADQALIEAARTQFAKGDKAKAAELLAQARKDFPESQITRNAGFLIAYWEKNPPKPGEAKVLTVPAPTGLDLNAIPQVGDTAAPAAGGTAAPTAGATAVPAAGATATPAPGGTPKPEVGGTAINALPAPVPPPVTPDPAGENPAPKPTQP